MRRQRGGALILTLGVLAGLVALLASAAVTQQVSLQALGNRAQARRARLVAESGLQRALAELTNQDPNQTLQADDWFVLGNTGDENFVVGNDSFRIQIIDASGQIDLNTASEEQLGRLPLTQEQIDSLLDWREAGQTPRQDGGKDEYYNALDMPYNAKLGPLTTIDELLLVKGFTAGTVFEPQTDVVSTSQQLPNKPDGTQPTLYDLCTVDASSGNVDANGRQKPNISTANVQVLMQMGLTQQQAQAIIAARPTTYARLLQLVPNPQIQRAIVNAFSVSNAQTLTGKIDVNTASEAVLETIPNMPTDVASSIVSRQSGGFTQLGDLFDVPGFSGQVAQQTLDAFTTNSRTFLIRVVGTAGQSHISQEALVDISGPTPRIVKISQMPYADMGARWGWNSETSSETVLKEAGQ